MSATANHDQNSERRITPKKFSHTVIRTTRLKEMVEWVRHEAQRWNDRKGPPPVQAGGESLERSGWWMQASREIAAPERYW